MNKQRLIVIVLAAAALCGWFLMKGCKPRMPQMPVPEAAAVTIVHQRAALVTELPGRTSAYRIAEIRPQVNGIIQKRLFTEGSDVNEGQVLYQIDPAPFEAAYNNAQASLNRAKASLSSIKARAERYKQLLEDKAVSQQEYDDAASALKQVEAEIQFWKASVENAKINLGYTSVKAPISGRIGKSSVTDGALVTAYQPLALATIQQLDPIYVDVPQSTAEMLRINKRLKTGEINEPAQKNVKLLLEDGSEYPLEGELQFRDVTVDPTMGSVILRAVFPNPEGILLPGMFVRAVITEGFRERAILIPQQSVLRNPKGDPYVFVVENGNIVGMRMLKIDRAIGNQWLVSAGLNVGDKVIVEGIQKIRPGGVVRVVPFEPNKDADRPLMMPGMGGR